MPNNRRRTKGRGFQYVRMPLTEEVRAKLNPVTTSKYDDISAWIQGLIGPMYAPPTKYKKITHS